MNQTRNKKKTADRTEMEEMKARRDPRNYPVPDYLKKLGITGLEALTEDMPLVYQGDNPFFPEQDGYHAGETPAVLKAGVLLDQLGAICKVKLGYSANPAHLMVAMFDGKPLYSCFCTDGTTRWCTRGEIEAEGELPLSALDIAAFKSPELRAVADQVFMGNSVDMKRRVYRLRGQWSDTYFVLVESRESDE